MMEIINDVITLILNSPPAVVISLTLIAIIAVSLFSMLFDIALYALFAFLVFVVSLYVYDYIINLSLAMDYFAHFVLNIPV